MPSDTALVVATFSRRMRLRLADGDEVEARIKGKRLKPVCGDRVTAEPIPGESDWLIADILERDNELTRPNLRGQIEVLAANIDLLVAVAAATPKPDWFVVDRYLCAAEVMRVPAAVVFNKTDIAEPDSTLAEYENIGYTTVHCSASSGDGLDRVNELLRDKTAIIVGQSGVGKSSIINALLGSEAQRTAAISAKTREGRHTTVNSIMLSLPGGGTVIDSPGVRDYAPALESAAQVIQGFREIEKAGHDCRFANCRHLQEPGCAVKAAVEAAQINARRYESFRRAVKRTVQATMQTQGALGCKIHIGGRLGGADMARREKQRMGRIPLQTLRANISFGMAEARTTYGVIGVKCWIYLGDHPLKKKRGAPTDGVDAQAG